MLFYYVQDENAKFFLFHFCFVFSSAAVNLSPYPHNTQNTPCSTCNFEASGVLLCEVDLGSKSMFWSNTVLLLWWWRDGWLKEINRHGADISQADKWQPQTWKAISGPRREWSPAKPCWFPWVSLLKHRPVPGRNTVVGVSTTSGPFWPLLLPTSMLT